MSTDKLLQLTYVHSVHKHVYAHTYSHTAKKQKPSAAAMWSHSPVASIGALLECYGSVQECLPGAGLVTCMRLYHVSQVRVWAPKVQPVPSIAI